MLWKLLSQEVRSQDPNFHSNSYNMIFEKSEPKLSKPKVTPLKLEKIIYYLPEGWTS